MPKPKPTLKNILIHCPKLGKNVTIQTDKLYFTGHEQEGTMYHPSAGSVEVSFDCKCGKSHEIELNSW